MAALKWDWTAMFILIFASLIFTCKCESVENLNEKEITLEAARPSETQHAEESSTEEVQADTQQWRATDSGVNEALGDSEAVSGINDAPGDRKSFTKPPAKDHFQEELVIRPLHSGDIYANFQFRTQLDTDFVQEGQKGCVCTQTFCFITVFSLLTFIIKSNFFSDISATVVLSCFYTCMQPQTNVILNVHIICTCPK